MVFGSLLLVATGQEPTGSAAAGQAPDPPLPELALPSWEKSFTLRGGAGYRDNILYSAVNQVDAPFLTAGLEAFLLKVPQGHTDFHLYLSAEDLRYLGPAPVDHEQTILSQAAWKWNVPWGHLGLDLQHFYQNQIFDLSVTETNLQSVLARAHDLGATPSVRYQLARAWWLEGDFRLRRQFILEPFDDYWEGGPGIHLGHLYGHRSELQFGYVLNRRDYDSRVQIGLDGLPLAEGLTFLQHRAEFSWRHYWDPRRRSRTGLKASVEWNLDNGPGYFDYRRARVALDHRYRFSTWLASLSVSYSRYDFAHQWVDPGTRDAALRTRDEIIASLRLEKDLTQRLRALATFEHENFLSNQALDTYRVNTFSAGIEWEF